MGKLKDIKITKSIIGMSILAAIFNCIMAWTGYSNINKINNYVNVMYEDRLMPLTEINSALEGFLNIRITVNQAARSYDKQYNDQIKNYDAEIQKHLKIYTSLNKLNAEQEKYIKAFNTNYKFYLGTWNSMNDSLNKGMIVNSEDMNKFKIIGEEVRNSLLNLKQYEITVAKNINTQSELVYKNSIKIFLAIFVVGIIVFAIISYVIIKVLRKSSIEVIENLERVSKGDFTIKIDTNGKNEFGNMRKALAKTVHNISLMFKNIKDNSIEIDVQSGGLSAVSEQIASASNNAALAVQGMAKGASEQAQGLIDINSILNDFGQGLEQIIGDIREIRDNAKDVDGMAKKSNEDMSFLINSIKQINDSFKEVSIKISELGKNISQVTEITSIINNIADQTSLLALNAAIEAARAGEAGKGFAVVADEIRKLAEQSKISSENINNVIGNVSKETEKVIVTTGEVNDEFNRQIDIVNTSIESFKEIILAINKIIPKIEGVNKSTELISDKKDSILEKVEEASSIAEEISASSEEIASSAEETNASTQEVASTAGTLNSMAKQMMDDLNAFKLE